MLADQILSVQWTNLDSLFIVLGGFSAILLINARPGRRIFWITVNTTINSAYDAFPHTAQGLSDHSMFHLPPAYRQK